MKKIITNFYIVLTLVVCPVSVSAQSVDYSGLQEIYGQPVTTSANGSPQLQTQAPLNMEIITAEEIRNTGARSITEVLRFVPGLSVNQKTFAQTEVSIRGYNQNNSDRILVLVNGRQVFTDFFGQVVWDNIPVEISEIKQIEVVKGPNTALFGFNAASGVVNIITFNPLYDDIKVIEARNGMRGFSELSGVVTQKVTDKVGFKFSSSGYRLEDDFHGINPAIRDEDTRVSFALDLWAQVSDSVQAQFEVTNNRNDRNEFNVPSGVNTFTEFDTGSARARIIADTSWGLIEADLYHNHTTADLGLFLGTTAGTSALEADNSITVAKLSDTFSLNPSNTFRLSGEYREANNIFSPTDGEDLTYNILSGSGLWDWRINDKLRSSVALRFDSFELDPDGSSNVSPLFPAGATPYTQEDFSQRRDEYSYNLGLVYEASETDTWRASVSRGVDLPSFTEFGLQFLSTPNGANPSGLATLGDPNIDTAIIQNYEIGFDRKIEEIDGLFRSAVFYQYNDGLHGFNAELNTIPNYFGAGLNLDQSFIGNIGDSEMYGIELGVEGKYKEKWDWFLNYTFINIEDDINNKQSAYEYSSSSSFENTNPEHVINAHLGYQAEKWRADLFGQYRSNTKGVESVSADINNAFTASDINDQFIVNGNFIYNFNDHISWSISGMNIVGSTQQSVEGDAEIMLWSTLKFQF